MEKKLVYFAHPVTHYNTKCENDCIREILIEAPNFIGKDIELFNPNQIWLDRIYTKRKNNRHEDPFGIFTEITSICDGCIGVTFIDGKMGAGVFRECMKSYQEMKPTYIMNLKEGFKIVSFSPSWESLSINETRERIKRKEM